MSFFTKLFVTAAVMCSAGFASSVYAKYPEKPISIITPFAQGSAADTNARFIARRFQDKLGMMATVYTDYVGDDGKKAVQTVIQAPADGYTLLMTDNIPVAANVAWYKDLPYDPVKDLTPIAKLVYSAMAVMVPASSPIQTIQQLVEEAKKRPGELKYGSDGIATQTATEAFLKQAQIDVKPVVFEDLKSSLQALESGQVDFVFADSVALNAQTLKEKMRMIATTSDKRLLQSPDVPSLQEAGYKDYFMVNWLAVYAPAGIPEDIKNVLVTELVDAYTDRRGSIFVERRGWVPFPEDGKALTKFQQSEIERWTKVMQEAKIPQK